MTNDDKELCLSMVNRLIPYISMVARSEKIDKNDLKQICYIATINAIKTYEPSHNATIYTWTVINCKCAIKKYIQNLHLIIRPSAGDFSKIRKITGEYRKLQFFKNIDDVILCEQSVNEEEIYSKVKVEKILKTLSDKNRDIITKLFGIGTTQHTMKDISENYSVTTQRIEQIKKKIFKGIKNNLKNTNTSIRVE